MKKCHFLYSLFHHWELCVTDCSRQMCLSERDLFCCVLKSIYFLHLCRSHSVGGLSRIWNNSCSQNRLQEPRGRHRLSTVIQPLRQNAGEVVDLTVDEDGMGTLHSVDGKLVLFVSTDDFCNCNFFFFCVSGSRFYQYCPGILVHHSKYFNSYVCGSPRA